MLWLSVILGVAHARDLVLPAFTPETLSDYGPAELLTELTLEALEEEGLEELFYYFVSLSVFFSLPVL